MIFQLFPGMFPDVRGGQGRSLEVPTGPYTLNYKKIIYNFSNIFYKTLNLDPKSSRNWLILRFPRSRIAQNEAFCVGIPNPATKMPQTLKNSLKNRFEICFWNILKYFWHIVDICLIYFEIFMTYRWHIFDMF